MLNDRNADAVNPESQAAPPTEEAAVSAFCAIFEALARVVSQALIDEAGWARLRAAVWGLPVDPGTGFGFELRLGEATAGSDFYIAMTRDNTLRGYLVRCGRRAPPGSVAASLGVRLAALDTQAGWCELLGLEFDAMPGSPDAPPGLFARIRPESRQTAAAAQWLTGAVGWQLTVDEARSLDRTCGDVAAAGGAVDCLGIMPSRPGRMIKVVCRPTNLACAVRILKELSWRGPVDRVAAFLSAFEGSFRSLRLAVGVTADGVAPRIGVEMSQSDPAFFVRPGTGDWAPFLTLLHTTGLCLPEKMEGLKAWPGREFVFSGHDTYGLLTGIGHIKLSFDAKGTAVEAKAYPAAAYRRFEAGRSWSEAPSARAKES